MAKIHENGFIQLKDLEGLLFPRRVNIGKVRKYWVKNDESLNQRKPKSTDDMMYGD